MLLKWKALGLGTLLLLFCLLLWFNITAHVRKDRLLKVLSENGTVVLSPSVTEALLSDLKSGDNARLEQWRLYLSMYTNTHLSGSTGLQDTYDLYISREKPARSNYFGRLVLELKLKMEREGPLDSGVLVGYLGLPDFTADGPNGQTLQYAFRYSGKNCLASAVVSNAVLKRIDIYVK